jgi:hypothetical protein
MALDVPQQPTGGILLDETESSRDKMRAILGLVSRSLDGLTGDQTPKSRSTATLVVTSRSLLGMWTCEAHQYRSKTSAQLRTLCYYGVQRCRDPAILADSDIVLTTYDVLQSDMNGCPSLDASSSSPPCHAVRWHRIILDDGHVLRITSNGRFKAAHALSSPRRWVCIASPVKTCDPFELHGIMRALHIEPLGGTSAGYLTGLLRSMPSHADAVPLLHTLRRICVRLPQPEPGR